jgi:hypothetical protein
MRQSLKFTGRVLVYASSEWSSLRCVAYYTKGNSPLPTELVEAKTIVGRNQS